MTHSCVNLRSRVRCFSPAVWPPIRRAHDPRRPDGGGGREGERESTMPRRRRPTEFCPAESGRMGIGKEGGRKGEKREKRKKISGTAAAAAAAAASAADGENDHQSYWLRQTEGRTEGAREALAAPGVAACSTEGRGDRRTGGHAGNRAVPRVGRSVRRCFAAALTYYSECDADGETGAKQR